MFTLIHVQIGDDKTSTFSITYKDYGIAISDYQGSIERYKWLYATTKMVDFQLILTYHDPFDNSDTQLTAHNSKGYVSSEIACYPIQPRF